MIETNYFNIYNASAGTGKTFSLVRDYLVLLFNSRNNELYKNILAITFTNKAVNEMKGRIVKYLINYSNCVDLDKKMIIEILITYQFISDNYYKLHIYYTALYLE